MTGRESDGLTRDYADSGVFQRLVRRSAATGPMTQLCVRVQKPMDRLVHQLTHGRTTFSSLLSGLLVVMLTTTGARTGRRHTVPVVGVPDGDRLLVVASNYGRPAHPGWYHNLRAHSTATVTVRGVTHEVEAHELQGHERDRGFRKAASVHPGFAVYEKRAADRRIPVLRFAPIVSGGSGAR